MNRRPRGFALLRIAMAAGLGVLLVFLILHAAERGIADLHAIHVRSQLERWQKNRTPVPLTEWRAALESAQAEHRLTPHNPDSAETLARVYDWAAFGTRALPRVARIHREQALTYFRMAVRDRPVSGYTWSNIAQAKLALQQVDSEFLKALESAALLAPWEPEVQLSLADAGLAAWSRLDGHSRAIVNDAVVRGFRRQAKDIFRIAQARSQSDVVCAIARTQPAHARACE